MATRTIKYTDGRQEVVQVLDDGRLSNWSEDDPLAFEASIMWLEDASQLPFVRSKLVRNCKSRRGKLNIGGGGRIVGYSKLTSDAPVDPVTQRYTRRVFYLRSADCESKRPITPTSLDGAVDPKTVAPGKHGVKPSGTIKQMPRLPAKPIISNGRIKKKVESFDSDVMQWMADAVAPSLSSRRPKPSDTPASQAQVDTELAHDEPDPGQSREKPIAMPTGIALGHLIPKSGSAAIPLEKIKVKIGRDEKCDVVLPFNSVSGFHCELNLEQGFWMVQDGQSTNGVKVNGVRISTGQREQVIPGTIISIGKYEFEIRYKVS